MAAAKHMRLSPETLELLKFSAVLHDIGKIGIEDRILRKQAPLDDAEAAEMKRHPLLGADILKRVPQLKEIVPGMLCHHERIDGRGYPNGFSDGQIPLIAKIISVADTYDAMTTTRPYRKALPTETALKELEKFSGHAVRLSGGEGVHKGLSAWRCPGRIHIGGRRPHGASLT